jgi:hypothetical protein
MGTDYSPLFLDAQARPEHYADLQDQIEALRHGQGLPVELRSTLMLRYVEPTAPPAVRDALTKMTKPDETPDPDDEEEELEAFEDQQAGKAAAKAKRAKADELPVFEDQAAPGNGDGDDNGPGPTIKIA